MIMKPNVVAVLLSISNVFVLSIAQGMEIGGEWRQWLEISMHPNTVLKHQRYFILAKSLQL